MQIEIYRRIIDLDAVKSLVYKDLLCTCGSRKPYVTLYVLPQTRSQQQVPGFRRKKCCHPVHQGDLFKYMSTLIKISNHLALILPCEFMNVISYDAKLSATR